MKIPFSERRNRKLLCLFVLFLGKSGKANNLKYIFFIWKVKPLSHILHAPYVRGRICEELHQISLNSSDISILLTFFSCKTESTNLLYPLFCDMLRRRVPGPDEKKCSPVWCYDLV